MEKLGVKELLGQDAKAPAKVEDGIEITGFAFAEDDVETVELGRPLSKASL